MHRAPDRAGSSTPRRALRLLARDPLPPIPAADDLVGYDVPRRPGELHEAFALGTETAAHVAAAALACGIDVDVAASVLLEAGLALSDVGPHRCDLGDPEPEPPVALPTAQARYLRSLTFDRRARTVVTPPPTASIPVRLVARAAGHEIDALVRTVPISTALEWEIAAVRTGRTLTEWVLRAALRTADGS